MHETVLLAITGIVVLGISAQWLAAQIRLPSILLLLFFGLVAGPATGFLNPDALFGETLFPLVSLSVALILYEGGLSLKLSDLPKVGGVVRNLVTIGLLITWGVGALAARLIFGMDIGVAMLLGAVLVVTGPTVIGPLLRHLRPSGSVGPILMWEGIVIDPIGAVLAVLVFEAIAGGTAGDAATAGFFAMAVFKTIVLGGGLGVLVGVALTLLIERYWIPDFLQSAVSLMLVVGVFTGANWLQPESGLLAATLMGITLANQHRVDVRRIVEFKENLRVLLISSLFILLAARLEPTSLKAVGAGGALFVVLLVVVARPLAAFVSTVRSGLRTEERLVLAWMAPRGIVAAAVSSVFALRLAERGYAGADLLVSITFLVIIATVAIYGLTSPLVARRLGVADPDPQGILFVGAHGWVRVLAALLQDKGFRILLVDSNRANITAARMAGLATYSGSILAEYAIAEMRLGGIGRLLAVTPNDSVNTLAVQRFTRVFGRANCYQLPPQREPERKPALDKHVQGRWLFAPELTNAALEQRFAQGATFKATRLSESFDFATFQSHYGETAAPLFVIVGGGRLNVVTADEAADPRPGDTLISLADEPSSAADAGRS